MRPLSLQQLFAVSKQRPEFIFRAADSNSGYRGFSGGGFSDSRVCNYRDDEYFDNPLGDDYRFIFAEQNDGTLDVEVRLGFVDNATAVANQNFFTTMRIGGSLSPFDRTDASISVSGEFVTYTWTSTTVVINAPILWNVGGQIIVAGRRHYLSYLHCPAKCGAFLFES